MNLSVLTKDPTKLPCPRCGEPVDAGATLSSMRALKTATLSCSTCHAPLAKKTTNYWSSIALVATMAASTLIPLAKPWNWVTPTVGLFIVFWLTAKEVASTRLVVRDEAQSHAHE